MKALYLLEQLLVAGTIQKYHFNWNVTGFKAFYILIVLVLSKIPVIDT